MAYTKPEAIVLGNAQALIARNSQGQKIASPAEPLSGDPDQTHDVPAYDLDE